MLISKEPEILSVPFPVEIGDMPGYRPVSFYEWYQSHSKKGNFCVETFYRWKHKSAEVQYSFHQLGNDRISQTSIFNQG